MRRCEGCEERHSSGLGASANFADCSSGNSLGMVVLGANTLMLTADNTSTGDTTILAGTLVVTAAANGLRFGGDVLNDGALQLDGCQTLGQLTGNGSRIIGGGNITVTLAEYATPDSFANTQGSLTIGPGSTLHITNSELFINYGSGTSPLAALSIAMVWGGGNNGGIGSATDANGAIIISTLAGRTHCTC